MIQENKELLLRDLCARVPYHPKGRIVKNNGEACEEWLTCATFQMFTSATNNVRLYLRPMSSMTEEEKRELFKIGCEGNIEHPYGLYFRCQDWLNAHYFDFRNLIERGLAIDCTGLNVY